MTDQIPQLAPNQVRFPSSPVNDPVFSPMLRPDSNFLVLSTVPQDTALGSLIGETEYSDQGPRDSLMALRLQFPHLEVIPFPSRVVCVALAQNVATDINIPDGTVGIVMRGNLDYYISANGGAAIPTVGGPDTQSIYKPEGYIMYVGGKRQLSCIAPNAGTIVTFMCYPLVPLNPR